MAVVTASAVPRPPRLSYIVHSLNPGGAERLVVEMSLAFQPEFDVDVCCLDEPGGWASVLRENDIPVHCLWRQPGLDLSMPTRLARHFRRTCVDIVHAHQCTPWFYAALARLAYGVPRLIFQEHGRFFPEVDNPGRRFINRHLIRRLTHRVVAVSNDVCARLERYEGLQSGEIEVVHNGVRPESRLPSEERVALRRMFGFGREAFVVGTVGRFDPIKNLGLMLRSLSVAARGLDHVRGLMVGDGPEFDSLRALAAQLGLTNRIVFTGHRNDARRLLQCMDLFVLSSVSEGISMALLEAMAVGVPVVVTAVGGNVEVVKDGVTGWLVPSDAVDELATAIRDAAGDPQQRLLRGLAGKTRFEDRFTFERMVEGYAAIYDQELSRATDGLASARVGAGRSPTRKER